MATKTAKELHQVIQRILTTAGADKENAELVAEHLVRANLSGVDTHGAWHVGGYVDAIKDGSIVPTAKPEIIKDDGNYALVSGNWTFGQVTAKFAMEHAIEAAKSHKMALVGVVQTHHIGRLGHYPEMAARAGMISMVWAGGYGEIAPATVPYGGRKPLLHTNPISMGFPAAEGTPVMFDFATTPISGVKVNNAKRRGESLPPGCIVDKDGRDSTNPNDFFEGGGHKPFGGHKGYALMMAAEYLGRIFTGSSSYADEKRAGPIMRHQGCTMMVMKADLFQSREAYQKSAEEMQDRAHAIPPAPGFDEVLMPGDPEARTRATRERDGIPIEDAIWQQIVECAAELGIKDV